MEMQDPKMTTMMITSQEEAAVVDEEEEEEEEAEVALPGFRFHPTDEELVSFYLKRKVEKKPFSFEIIKQIDIYRYDPWDLAKVGSVGDKEWYFYCKRGRKYKNSLRPNRVTGSGGFWKATGIDRPIYDSSAAAVSGSAGVIVGLKKSLVYYRGSAGKGTKTDWMMHEFRLPSQPLSSGSSNSHLPEAEIWTLCRILKRSRKHTPDWREFSSKRVSITTKNTSISAQSNNTKERYISFTNPSATIQPQQPQHFHDPHGINHVRRESEEQMIFESENMIDYSTRNTNPSNHHNIKGQWASPLMDHQTYYASELASNFSSPLNTTSSVYDQDQVDDGNYWEDLSSVVEFAMRELYD